MQIFLAGIAPWKEEGLYDKEIEKHKPYILESFYYIDKDTERLLPYYGDFMLDSGAFTFMQESFGEMEWEEYIEKYANFINKHDVAKFFELDIDYVVGYEKVKEYRQKLEKLTGKQCIPVWHKPRGVEEYKRLCAEYSYIAIGASGRNEDSRWTRTNPEIVTELISIAHKESCKVHGLGYTNLKMLPRLHFDSVDSTAWTAGNRFGYVYQFDGKSMNKIDVPKGKRLKDSKAVALNNYIEWIKFQRYAERKL